MVRVGQYVSFDPGGGPVRIRTEQDFWKEVPAAFAAIRQPPVLDMGLPKPGAEVLLAGLCRAPGQKPVPALEISFRVGPVLRRLAVFGDRERLPGGGFSDPLPFVSMPLTWDRAFGGPDFAANPTGKGLDTGDKPGHHAPNVEDRENLFLSADDRPQPACPFSFDLTNPLRRALSGTYDQDWLENRWPAYPDDCDPEFFYSAQPAQRLAGRGSAPRFFTGDEDIEIIGMHHDHPVIRGKLPETRVRAFVTTVERFTPFAPARQAGKEEPGGAPALPYAKDPTQNGVFREVDLRLDTIWLLPDLLGAYILRRGLLPVVDDEMDDVLRVFVISENPRNEAHSLEYWREEEKKRIWPVGDFDFPSMHKAREQMAKAMKKARDMPKSQARMKKEELGRNPTFPFTPGDSVHWQAKSLAGGRVALAAAEKQVLDKREAASHLVNFAPMLESLSKARAGLDAQEKILDETLLLLEKECAKLPPEITRDIHASFADLKYAVAESVTGIEGAPLDVKSLNTLAVLDNLSMDGGLRPAAPATGREACFELLAAARRRLSREPGLLRRLEKMGIEARTLEDNLLGYSPDACSDSIPAGLYVPRFEDAKLVALRGYPVPGASDPDGAWIRWRGADAGEIVLIPGSDPSPLSLPASLPGGAVCVAPEDLSALFAEQEAGDFCHIVATADPAALAGIADPPPLASPALAGVSAQDGGLPLAVILPPGQKGKSLFASWRAAWPAAVPLYLPDGCPHVLALAERGHSLRRLLLDCLPPDLAKRHDFEFPLPDKGPPEPFALNVSVPTREEIEQRAATLLGEVHDPGKAAALRDVEEDEPTSQMLVAEALKKRLADTKACALAAAKPDEKLLTEVAETERNLDERLRQLAALRKLSRGEVEALLAEGSSLEGRNLQGLDLSGLNFSGVSLKRVLCGKTSFSGCRMDGADFTAALVGEADFSGASLRGAVFKQVVLNKVVLRGADLSEAAIEGAGFSECDAAGAVFDRTKIELSSFARAVLDKASFVAASLSLCLFSEFKARATDFCRCRAFKCLFRKADLKDALFRESALNECLFQGAAAAGLSFAGADLRKFYADGETDLSGADFSGADLRECSLRLTRLTGADFYQANLEKAVIAQSDLSDARLDGLRGASCRFLKCDLNRADLAGANLFQGSLRKCRLTGADLSGAGLYAADLRHLVIDGDTRFTGANCKRTLLDGKEEALRDAARRDS
jgi:uncharacterized protein YjbI with pentapeptide repeats